MPIVIGMATKFKKLSRISFKYMKASSALQVDGLGTGAALNGGGVSTYVADISNAQEVVTTNSGGMGEAEVGGPAMNIVPRSGGNTIKGQIYLSTVPSSFVSSNYTQALKDAGLSTPGQLIKQWDETFGIGGPIKKDRLWYYGTYRDEGQHRSIPGIFPNLNAGDPTKWEYAPDTTRQARGAESFQLASIRLTAQVTPRNKVNFHWDMQWPCNGASFTEDGDACRTQSSSDAFYGSLGLGGLTATSSPETAQYLRTLVQNHQVTWQSPVTNRLLLEAGVGTYRAAWGAFEMPGNPTRGLAARDRAHGPEQRGGEFQLPLRQLGARLRQPQPVALLGLVCHRRAQPEVRVQRQLPRRRHPELRERPESRLHVQRRPALAADREPSRVHPEGPGENHGAVRPGPVDLRTDDAAGRGAVRQRLELFAAADDRPRADQRPDVPRARR